MEILNNIWQWMLTEGIKIVLGLLVLYILCKVINIVTKKLEKSLSKKKIDKTITVTTISIVRKVLKVLLFILFLTFLGIETSSIAGVITSIGLTVGLSLQGSLSNLAGGIILILLRPFKIGDWVECSEGAGTIEKIELFFTQIATIDNKLIMVPNSSLANGKIINYSAKKTRCWNYNLSISYEADFKKAKLIILNCIKESNMYLIDPEPFVHITKHNDSSIDLVVRAWVRTADYWKFNWYMLEAVKEAFDRNNISIPYPQMDVHIKNDNEIQPIDYNNKNYSIQTNSGKQLNIENDGKIEFNNIAVSKNQLDKYDAEVDKFDKLISGKLFKKHPKNNKKKDVNKELKVKKPNKRSKKIAKNVGKLTVTQPENTNQTKDEKIETNNNELNKVTNNLLENKKDDSNKKD